MAISKISLVIAGLIIFMFSLAFAQEESVTITTYYPSPYGVYNELKLHPHSPYTTECTASEEGLLFYDNDPADAAERGLKICKDSRWQLVGGGGGEAPTGAVMFFKRPGCPSGWHEFPGAKGRYIVGGGEVGKTVGQPLTDGEERNIVGRHTHTISPNPHDHWPGTASVAIGAFPGSTALHYANGAGYMNVAQVGPT